VTTLVHIVNFGPDPIDVKVGQQPAKRVFARQSFDAYVYRGQDIAIAEARPALDAQPAPATE
jgi:hypothetical protein